MNENEIFKEVLLTSGEIDLHCDRLAREIERDYVDEDNVIFIGLLKGCHPFMSDLLSRTTLLAEVDYMDVSSYLGGTEAQQEVQIIKDLSTSVKNRKVILVEDVVDSGRTIKKVIDLLKFRGATSVEVVAMIDKPTNRTVDLYPKYIGKELAGEFIVGYGLDYKEYLRNFRQIGIPTEEILEELNEK